MRYTMLGVAAATALVIAIVVGSSAPAQTTGQTLTFKEPAKGGVFKFIDVAPKARQGHAGLGDQFVFNNRLNDAGGAQAGRVDAHCTVTETSRKDSTFVCTGF